MINVPLANVLTSPLLVSDAESNLQDYGYYEAIFFGEKYVSKEKKTKKKRKQASHLPAP